MYATKVVEESRNRLQEQQEKEDKCQQYIERCCEDARFNENDKEEAPSKPRVEQRGRRCLF